MGILLSEVLDHLEHSYKVLMSRESTKRHLIERVEWLDSAHDIYIDRMDNDVLYLIPPRMVEACIPLLNETWSISVLTVGDRNIAENLCTQANFALSCVIDDRPYQYVFNNVINLVPKLIGERASVWQFNEIIRCKDIQSIANMGSGLLGNPVAVLDRVYNIVALTADPSGSSLWNTLQLGKYVAVDGRSVFPLHSAFQQSANTGRPVTVPLPAGGECIVKTILMEHSILGYIFVYCYNHSTLDPDRMELLDLMSISAAKLMLSQIKTLVPQPEKLDIFLSELLLGKEIEPEAVEFWLKEIGWKIGSYSYLIIIRNPDGSTMTQADIEKLAIQEKDRAFLFKGDIIWIISQEYPLIGVDEERIQPLHKILAEEKWIAGISRRITSLGSIAKFYRQAHYSMELCLKNMPSKRMLPYNQAWIDDLIDAVRDKISLEEYCVPQLLALERYDKTHQKQLMETLTCYFENNQSVQKTAECLYIHRNTVNYRLSKCAEILETDLSDRGRSARIFLALKILSCLRTSEDKNYNG